MSPDAKRILRRIGWGYAAYHVLVATLIVVSAALEINGGSWKLTQFLLELLFVLLVYPALIPAFVVCGGLHDHCTTILGHSVQVTVFVMMATCYGMACWALTSFIRQRRFPTSART